MISKRLSKSLAVFLILTKKQFRSESGTVFLFYDLFQKEVSRPTRYFITARESLESGAPL